MMAHIERQGWQKTKNLWGLNNIMICFLGLANVPLARDMLRGGVGIDFSAQTANKIVDVIEAAKPWIIYLSI